LEFRRVLFRSKEDVIKSLLQSPFSRRDGIVRKKVIAIIGANKKPNEPIKQVEELNNLGFHIVSIGEETSTLTKETFNDLKDIPYDVDVAWLHGNELVPTLTEQLINKQVNALWIENASLVNPTLSHRSEERRVGKEWRSHK